MAVVTAHVIALATACVKAVVIAVLITQVIAYMVGRVIAHDQYDYVIGMLTLGLERRLLENSEWRCYAALCSCFNAVILQ